MIKTKLTKILLKISVLVIILTLSSCGAMVKGIANNAITEEKGAIPPEFGNDNTTLVFITAHKSYNKYLKKAVVEEYKGKYEYATAKQVENNEKYKDSTKYRYFFGYIYRDPFVSRPKNAAPVKSFRVYDMKEDKIFRSKVNSGMWSKLLKVYLKKLNEKRLQYQS